MLNDSGMIDESYGSFDSWDHAIYCQKIGSC